MQAVQPESISTRKIYNKIQSNQSVSTTKLVPYTLIDLTIIPIRAQLIKPYDRWKVDSFLAFTRLAYAACFTNRFPCTNIRIMQGVPAYKSGLDAIAFNKPNWFHPELPGSRLSSTTLYSYAPKLY